MKYGMPRQQLVILFHIIKDTTLHLKSTMKQVTGAEYERLSVDVNLSNTLTSASNRHKKLRIAKVKTSLLWTHRQHLTISPIADEASHISSTVLPSKQDW